MKQFVNGIAQLLWKQEIQDLKFERIAIVRTPQPWATRGGAGGFLVGNLIFKWANTLTNYIIGYLVHGYGLCNVLKFNTSNIRIDGLLFEVVYKDT